MDTDFLVIGSGIAGLNFALKAARYGKVVIVTKDKIEESNTFYAQGGLAAVFGKDDSTRLHIQDTLRTGDGISNRKIAEILAKEAPKAVMELKRSGVRFDSDKDGFKLSREAVHSRARIVHVSDITGREIEKVLVKKVKENKNIVLLEYHMAIKLLTENKRCIGCVMLDVKNNRTLPIFSKKIILAAGGAGMLYSKTTNPEITTGDGMAIAFKAGAVLEDMEFIQFHPTMLHNSSPSLLISETLRGEGALLKNKYGKTYMKKYHRDGELAPRDVVARFSTIEMKKTGSKNVYLDITHLNEEYLKKRFHYIYEECLKYKIDITKDMIPVSPAAHYMCGGIKIDEYGRTNIASLYAIGECACTQLHGADRLASNSLTEGMVFGTRLIGKIKKEIKKDKIIRTKIRDNTVYHEKNGRIKKLRKQLQNIMWQHAGIIRSKKGLKIAHIKIDKIKKKLDIIKNQGINKEILELNNLIRLAKIIIISALRRKESRGTHFIKDYNERHDNIWQMHLTIDKEHVKLK
ncbi:MAG: L-aspartate oxidase [Nanoarchaeota archaeon]|nr:L-aspartate oxidase [Nanoarchaeota archaeon]